MITLDIAGNPTPTSSDVFLFRDSSTPSVTHVLESGTVTITFSPVKRSDSGQYTLFVNTTLGDDSVTFTLDVGVCVCVCIYLCACLRLFVGVSLMHAVYVFQLYNHIHIEIPQ